MKTLLKLSAAVALCAAGIAQAQSSAPIKVGLMLPYTGTYAALGNMIENGARRQARRPRNPVLQGRRRVRSFEGH
jgi:outer membrane PBP1 activator LpoA protein